MPVWVICVALYGIIKGMRDIVKKKALKKNTVPEVLFFYTLIGFVFLLPDAPAAFALEPAKIGVIFIKSAVIFVAWMCSFAAIRKMPVSFYGVMDMSRVIFATILGTVFLHEAMSVNRIVGLVLVLAGLLLVNFRPGGEKEPVRKLYLFMVLTSCFMNAISEMMDKVLMGQMESGQLQFWYMFFMLLLYLGAMIATKTKIDFTIIWKNPWILLLSVLFIIGDRLLFIGNQDPESNVVVMTLIKQCSVLVTIIGGRLVFQEKQTGYKLACACVIIAGIMAALI